MLLRIVVKEFAAAALVVEWHPEHCGESVVVNSCWPAVESPVVCAQATETITAAGTASAMFLKIRSRWLIPDSLFARK